MRIFTDLEFSNLTDDAELISIGAITESGETCYIQVSPLPCNCSAFVHAEFIPHLELATYASPADEVEARFADWLQRWPTPALYVDSARDIFVRRKTFTGKTSLEPGPLQPHPHDKPPLTCELRLDTTYECDGLLPYFDARALRAAVLAAEDAAKAKGWV